MEAIDLFIYGEIGDVWWDEESVTASSVAEALAEIPKNQPINLRINSPGGAINDGLAIYNQLRRRSNVTAYIDGYACSAASFIALAADKVISPASSIWMVHPPSGICFGSAEDMRSTADALDTHNDAVLAIYTSRTGLSEERVKELLDAETWFTGTEAVELGFATEAPEEAIAAEQKVIPMQFRAMAKGFEKKLEDAGWTFGRVSAMARGTGRRPLDASILRPAMSAVEPEVDDREFIEDEEVMTDKIDANSIEPAKISQMSEEIRDLKIKLSAAEKLASDRLSEIGRLNITTQYWQMRSSATTLFSVENKLTEEEFTLDFSEDPKVDIDRLITMDADDARIELKTMDRALRRAAMKQPIDRVSRPEDKAKLGNSSIKSQAVDVDPGVRSSAGDESNPDRAAQLAKADAYLAKAKPPKIG